MSPWITRTDYEPPHTCSLPSLDPMYESTYTDPVYYTYPAGPGSIWECEVCGAHWRVMLAEGELEWFGPLWGRTAPWSGITLAKHSTVEEVNWATHGVPAPNINPELLKEGNR